MKENKDKTSNKIWKKIIFSFLACLLWGGFVHCDSFEDFYSDYFGKFESFIDKHEGETTFSSLNVPFGGRAEALSGVFTALANDISFFEYNPAASSLLKNTELALFHSFWIADSYVDTLAFSIRENNLGLGTFVKCLYLPFTEYNIFGKEVNSSFYSESFFGLNISYNILAGYNFKGLATGATIKIGYRSMPDYVDNETNTVINKSGKSQSAFAILGDFGIKTNFNLLKLFESREPNLHIGISLMNIGAVFEKTGINFAIPTQLNCGFAWNMLKPITLTLEIKKPINLAKMSHSGTLSYGAGLIYNITEGISVQTGFLLKGGNPRITLGAEFPVKSFSFNLNYTFDATTSFSTISKFSLAAKVHFGDRGRSEEQDIIDKLYVEGLQLYAEGYYEEAIAKWEKILIYNKRYDPAKSAIVTAEETLALRNRIIELQTIDDSE